MRSDSETRNLFVHKITDRAILVSDGDGEKIWLPKSQVDFPSDIGEGDFCDIDVPEWLLDAKGL